MIIAQITVPGCGTEIETMRERPEGAGIIVEAAWPRSGKSSMTTGRTSFSEGTGDYVDHPGWKNTYHGGVYLRSCRGSSISSG